MFEWWNSLSLLGQVFATIAIPATIIMVLQTILLLIGFGMDGDADISNDVDIDGDVSDGLALFTVRGIVTMFSIGGWVGVVSVNSGLPNFVSILLATISGLIALFGIALFFKYAMKLQSDGTLDINNSIGKSGRVYIPIPPQRKGTGQITVLVQERLKELDAVTDNDAELKTGEYVEVVEIIDEQTVLVKSKSTEAMAQGGISKFITN